MPTRWSLFFFFSGTSWQRDGKDATVRPNTRDQENGLTETRERQKDVENDTRINSQKTICRSLSFSRLTRICLTQDDHPHDSQKSIHEEVDNKKESEDRS